MTKEERIRYAISYIERKIKKDRLEYGERQALNIALSVMKEGNSMSENSANKVNESNKNFSKERKLRKHIESSYKDGKIKISYVIESNTYPKKMVVEDEFNLSDFVIGEYPNNCYECPAGFCANGMKCGRNVPFKADDSERRPDTCRLISYTDFLKRENKDLKEICEKNA